MHLSGDHHRRSSGGGKSEEGVSRSVSSSSSSSFSRHTLSPSVSKTPSARKDGHWTFGPQQEEIQQLFPAYNIDKQKNEHLAVHLAGQLGKCLGVLVESLSNSPSHLSLTDGQTDVQTTAVATCYGRVFVVVVVCHPLWFLSSPPLFTPLLSCLSSPVKQRANGGEDKFNIKFVSIFNAGNGQMFHIAKVLSSNDFCHFWRGNGGCMKPSSSSSFFSRQKRSSCQLSSPPPFGWGRERREGLTASVLVTRATRKEEGSYFFFEKKKRVGNGSVSLSFNLRPPPT